jgi:DNA-binding transcriptional LysR family regulator
VRLFDRERRGIRPTPLGAVVLARAREVVAGVRELERDLALHQGLEVGTLAIGAGPVIAETRLAPALAALARERPALRVHVRTDHWQALTRALEAGEIELYAGEPPAMEHAADFRIQPLTPDPGVFFCRAGHPLVRRRRVSLADLRGHPILGPRLPARIRDWLVPAGTAPGQVVECESFAVLAAMAADCHAVGIAPLSAIADHVRAGRLRVIAFDDARLAARAAVVSLRERTLSPAAEAFVEALHAADRRRARADATTLRVG